MADRSRALPQNVTGDFFVDDTCIDCDTCRQIAPETFGTYHKPQEDRLRQLLEELPKLEAEVAHIKIHDLSAAEILREAQGLYARWPSLALAEKRKIVQAVVQKITIGKDEIEISYSYLPSSEELTKSQQLL